MSIWIIAIILLLISFIWSLMSLRDLSKNKELKKVKEELLKGKTIFQHK